MGITEVSSVNWHDAGGDYVEIYLDMSGPWADLLPLSKLMHLCVVVEPDPGLGTRRRTMPCTRPRWWSMTRLPLPHVI